MLNTQPASLASAFSRQPLVPPQESTKKKKNLFLKFQQDCLILAKNSTGPSYHLLIGYKNLLVACQTKYDSCWPTILFSSLSDPTAGSLKVPFPFDLFLNSSSPGDELKTFIIWTSRIFKGRPRVLSQQIYLDNHQCSFVKGDSKTIPNRKEVF